MKNYRALRDVSVSLGTFQVLVGPNASGKSTLLDVLAFVRDCLKAGLVEAVRRRAGSVDELTFAGRGGEIELQVELDLTGRVPDKDGWCASYDFGFTSDPATGVRVVREDLSAWPRVRGREDHAIHTARGVLLKKSTEGSRPDTFLVESGPMCPPGPGAMHDAFEFGPETLAFSELPPDRTRYPTANAIRTILEREVTLLDFVSREMGQPCPALEPDEFIPSGRNLARVAARLLSPRANGTGFDRAAAKADWLEHLRLALPDLVDLTWAQREDDRAEYLRMHFEGGWVCPSWTLSAGTLRMVGLTLPAFLPPQSGLHLIEEPENAVHPHALEIIVGALRSIARSQVLVTTHSPLVVDLVGSERLLVFSKENGEVRVRPGVEHPALEGWDGSPALSTLFSAGYLR